MSGAAAAVLRGVSYRYPERTAFALRGIDWTIEAGSFVVVTGPSGSGKSTLLRCLNGLVPHFSGGELGGQALVAGLDTREHGPRVLSQHVGFVFQDPEAQLVTTRVDDELAFGMEQRGVPPLTMRKRVEEVLDLLGIADLRQREVTTLSGGERQRVAVAAALALQPSILVLDEPTSQLDPWGAESVLAALSRLNEELGLTIVLAEHRLERVMARADVLRYLPDPGMLGFEGNLRDVMVKMEADFLPPLVQIARDRGWRPLPLTIKEGRAAVRRDRAAGWEPPSLVDSSRPSGAPVPRVEAARGTEVRAEHYEVLSGLSTGRSVHTSTHRPITVVRVSAGFNGTTVLSDIDLEAGPGEVIALMGRNGSGKTTLLRLLTGMLRPTRGRITLFGQDIAALDPAEIGQWAGYVPQNPGSLLFAETLRDELAFTRAHHPRSTVNSAALMARLGLGDLLLTHPRDLSGGERQRAALAAILIGDPPLLLLDEPTRGMDGRQKRILAGLLRDLRSEGKTIFLATHDIELVATTSTRVILLGGGRIVADGTPRQVLSGSLTYATQVNKLFGGEYITVADVYTAPHSQSWREHARLADADGT
ncbi:MAG: energy-coupling factor ABC transporter ATP-binding protein [Chloroflexota bacterium]|nr:energy-coupling factor ABC transporter ATP-binding protein [Chloroflexota bacterium]